MNAVALRVALKAQPATGQHMLPGRCVFPVAVGIALTALAAIPTFDASATILLAIAILAFGLPHGALDIAQLERGPAGLARGVGLYLAASGVTAALWLTNGTIALLLFLMLAAWHFAEDWDHLPKPLAMATSAAVITAPTLIHGEILRSLFVIIANDTRAAALADIALLLAPVLLMTAVAGVFFAWGKGESERAIAAVAALVAMIFLPPLVGFALVFCLHHSPRQFSQACRELGWTIAASVRPSVILATLGGCALAVVLFGLIERMTVTDAALTTVFVTLSVLTVPHMLLPIVTRALSRS